jgi:hypothetical protein
VQGARAVHSYKGAFHVDCISANWLAVLRHTLRTSVLMESDNCKEEAVTYI